MQLRMQTRDQTADRWFYTCCETMWDSLLQYMWSWSVSALIRRSCQVFSSFSPVHILSFNAVQQGSAPMERILWHPVGRLQIVTKWQPHCPTVPLPLHACGRVREQSTSHIKCTNALLLFSSISDKSNAGIHENLIDKKSFVHQSKKTHVLYTIHD